MFKRISGSLMTLMIVGKTLSAEPTEHEKFTSDRKAYYASHSANQTDKTEKFITFDISLFTFMRFGF